MFSLWGHGRRRSLAYQRRIKSSNSAQKEEDRQVRSGVSDGVRSICDGNVALSTSIYINLVVSGTGMADILER